MQKLNFPEFGFKIKEKDQISYIFDAIRKKYLVLTPEEWVRQHTVAFLVSYKEFPSGLITLERSIRLNGMIRRPDILASDKNGKAIFIVECKAASVPINQDVFDQVVRYNMVLEAKYVMVTNGLEHYVCKIDFKKKTYQFLKEIPSYQKL